MFGLTNSPTDGKKKNMVKNTNKDLDEDGGNMKTITNQQKYGFESTQIWLTSYNRLVIVQQNAIDIFL